MNLDHESPLIDQQVRDGSCIRDESEAGGDSCIVYTNIGCFSDDKRYKLVKYPFVLDKNFKFSNATDSSGHNRLIQ